MTFVLLGKCGHILCLTCREHLNSTCCPFCKTDMVSNLEFKLQYTSPCYVFNNHSNDNGSDDDDNKDGKDDDDDDIDTTYGNNIFDFCIDTTTIKRGGGGSSNNDDINYLIPTNIPTKNILFTGIYHEVMKVMFCIFLQTWNTTRLSEFHYPTKDGCDVCLLDMKCNLFQLYTNFSSLTG